MCVPYVLSQKVTSYLSIFLDINYHLYVHAYVGLPTQICVEVVRMNGLIIHSIISKVQSVK